MAVTVEVVDEAASHDGSDVAGSGPAPRTPFDAVVLAGGAARRLGGAAKPQITIDGVRLLDRVIAAVAGAERVVVVGPRQPLDPPVMDRVVWCREQPPGGGPVAGLAAALPVLDAPVVVVLAADLPWIAPAVPLLVRAVADRSTAGSETEAAFLVDGGGRVNRLAGAWRRAALAAALAALGEPQGAAMRTLVRAVQWQSITDDEGWGQDCDTWDDVAAARARPMPG